MKTLRFIMSLSIMLCFGIPETSGQFTMYEGMAYQGVARDVNGNPIANQTISLMFKLNFAISWAYHETQSVTTDDRGLFTATIGEGTYFQGQFTTWDEINWDGGAFYTLSVEADFTGGTNYQFVGGSTIRAVPYANMSRRARVLGDSAWVAAQSGGAWTNKNVGIGTAGAQVELDVKGSVRIAEPGNVNGPDPSASLDMGAAKGALLLPQLTTVERDALTATPGMIIFNLDASTFQGYGGFENGAFASNTANSASSSASSPNCGLGCVDGRRAYQTFEVAVPTQVDSIRFHVASWTSDGTPAWSYNFTIAEGSPDNPVGGSEVSQGGFAFSGSPGPAPSGSVTINFGTPYQLMPGVQYHFSVASAYGFTASLEASADGAGTYGNGEQWERVATGSSQSTPPTITFNQLASDLRFEIYSGGTVAGWSDLH